MLDFISVSTILLRMVLTDREVKYEFIMVGYVFTNTSFVTVALMCVERLVLCLSPMWYTAYFQHSRLRKVAVCIWLAVPFAGMFFRFVVCQQLIQTSLKLQCSETLGKVISGNVYIVVAISYACYFKIFLILRTKRCAHEVILNSSISLAKRNITTIHHHDNKLQEQIRVGTPASSKSNPGLERPSLISAAHCAIDTSNSHTKTNTCKVTWKERTHMSKTGNDCAGMVVREKSLNCSNDKSTAQSIDNVLDTAKRAQKKGDGRAMSDLDLQSKSPRKVLHVMPNSGQFSLRNRNTYLVFAYLVTMTLALMSVLIFYFMTGEEAIICTGSLVILMLNGALDPCLYVFWFRECRMELKKIFAVCRPSLFAEAELERIQLFDIVTVKKETGSLKPKA